METSWTKVSFDFVLHTQTKEDIFSYHIIVQCYSIVFNFYDTAYIFDKFTILFLSYIQYSNIVAKVVRRSLKEEFKVDALKRDESSVRFTNWKEGKPETSKLMQMNFTLFHFG